MKWIRAACFALALVATPAVAGDEDLGGTKVPILTFKHLTMIAQGIIDNYMDGFAESEPEVMFIRLDRSRTNYSIVVRSTTTYNCGSAGCLTVAFQHTGCCEWNKVLEIYATEFVVTEEVDNTFHVVLLVDRERWTWSETKKQYVKGS